VQAWSTPDVGLRGPLAPGPAVAERAGRASDVLPPTAAHARSFGEWTAALVASVARTAWLAVVLTAAFVGGVFIATVASSGSLDSALPWALIGGGIWFVVVALAWTLLRRRRQY